MKKLAIMSICLIALIGFAQDIIELKDVKPTEDYENIWVKKISDDSNQTSFVIWIKESVRLHKHVDHSENIYILAGKGEMTIGERKLEVKKGDYFNIPKGTPHALNVLSSGPVKVLSIQSPQFLGKDRIFLDE